MNLENSLARFKKRKWGSEKPRKTESETPPTESETPPTESELHLQNQKLHLQNQKNLQRKNLPPKEARRKF